MAKEGLFLSPVFNEHLTLELKRGTIKKLAIEVCHEAGEEIEPVVIGEGVVSLDQLSKTQPSFHRIYKTVIHSTMSQQTEATLDIRVQIQPVAEIALGEPSELDSSMGESQVEDIMSRVNQAARHRKNQVLFDSSDED